MAHSVYISHLVTEFMPFGLHFPFGHRKSPNCHSVNRMWRAVTIRSNPSFPTDFSFGDRMGTRPNGRRPHRIPQVFQANYRCHSVYIFAFGLWWSFGHRIPPNGTEFHSVPFGLLCGPNFSHSVPNFLVCGPNFFHSVPNFPAG